MEKFCDVSLETLFADVITITSPKWHHTDIFEVRFRHNPLEKLNLKVTKIGG